MKGWASFQHYKHRSPPWIKLHRALLEDHAIAVLPDHQKAHLFGIWLLAAAGDGLIPDDAEFVARRINATTPVDLQLFIRHGFLAVAQSASTPLADCQQNAPLVEESRVEKSRDRVETARASQPEKVAAPELRDTAPAVQVAQAANRGAQANPLTATEAGCHPLTPDRAQQATADWLAAGIPLATVLSVVEDVARRFTPAESKRRISGFRYFDAAIREAHAAGQPGGDAESRTLAALAKAQREVA